MKEGLTIAYVTSRRDCRIQWFFESLAKQMGDRDIEMIVVDHWHAERNVFELPGYDAIRNWTTHLHHVSPKPNVWNGTYRLTSQDWFAMASARNTSIALCKTSHLAFCDDLSVLMPGWLDAVYETIAGGYIGLGAYKKVRNLVVENGVPVSFEETESGTDNRLSIATKDVSECTGEWLYGSSLVAPLDALMSVDGWPESIADGMGFEDCLMGIVLQNAGYHLKYDKRMLTLESDELHSSEPAMRREDYGVSPNDKSHRALEIARASKTFDNGFGEGGIRALRRRVLAGESFPIQNNPRHEWFTGVPLEDL